MKATTRATSGFTLVEIMIAVAILGLLMAIAIPNFARARTQTQKNICVGHLREIDSIKQQWALEWGKSEGSEVAEEDLMPYFRGNRWPECPAGGRYEINGVGEHPTCSLGDSLGHKLED
ncbi:MAG: type II secretion system protein [Limisphaera sp.]